MPIGKFSWIAVLVFGWLLGHTDLDAQTSQDPSITPKPFAQYWTKSRVVPKFGVGTQDRAFLEVGVQYHSIYKHSLTLLSHGPYCTVDVFIDDSNILLGPKLGYEFTAGLLGAAVDLTYYIDHNYDGEGGNRNGMALTPKVGLTVLGFADLFYGYTIPVTDETIGTITRNRFSLVINLNKDYFDLRGASRR
jgi:hypothetical protein